MILEQIGLNGLCVDNDFDFMLKKERGFYFKITLKAVSTLTAKILYSIREGSQI